ncbi:4-hydroxy-tetrahydrodipicolinate synthase [Acidaminococcus sp. NSJ-142]|jgi:4-hydroxy-tetrahydrodipicolinate synthase|uniref:4-hydroxy-tetrahydrodipicolinate synthase n=1 Tax=Acidaminococcus TaxID=904 RepID=UPI000CF9E106|nr:MULTISPECIES: 4-hydroxy-tetrahydrodipicolinate synthase [Acidaminococcus]MCD2435528.1 4-hydroxy-tetrahydrodipicolinate synthase [Acidaminococcus hominis]MCH4095516.1 4-hydroxy-tetrahydrodipicolinate synthase [Acidaminococcus provencensis]RHK01808.1 4-hydroxy-tetrahydrodipicolinate synthase [Acidaminococcus sp. AM05-11]
MTRTKPYFGRLMTAMVTFFHEDGSLNADGTADFAAWLVEHGSDAILVSGTSGEAPTMTVEEKEELFTKVIAKINHKAPVIVGTGSNNTADVLKMNELAEKVGADGVLVVGPYYNKPSQEGFYQHFKTIAEHTKLPIIIYNVPGRTGTNILPETINRLARECSNIVAVKEASGNVSQVAELYRIAPEDFSIYSGDDGLILPLMSVGAVGLISVLSNVGGELLQDLMTSYEKGEVQKARDLNAKMIPQARSMFLVSNPIPIKEAVTKMTPFNAGPYRLPLCPMTDAERAKVTAAWKESGLL